MVDVSTTSFLPEAKFWMQSAQGTVVIEDWEMNGRMVRRTGAEEDDAYYTEKGYVPKNAPLDTVDELLLVKGLP